MMDLRDRVKNAHMHAASVMHRPSLTTHADTYNHEPNIHYITRQVAFHQSQPVQTATSKGHVMVCISVQAGSTVAP